MAIIKTNKYLMFVLFCLTVASCKTTNNKESKKNSPVVVDSITLITCREWQKTMFVMGQK